MARRGATASTQNPRFNLVIDDLLRSQAEQKAKEKGITLATLIRAYIKLGLIMERAAKDDPIIEVKVGGETIKLALIY